MSPANANGRQLFPQLAIGGRECLLKTGLRLGGKEDIGKRWRFGVDRWWCVLYNYY
ncbi:MAG: hypothetical protein HFG66_13970 [Hungatella sp.]|nr:hypothetical protein [Hungatella sp.]